MIAGLTFAGADPERLLHPTGEFAARFMIIAMIISPLRLMFPKSGSWMWMMRRRRYFGVAAFAYAVLHTVLNPADQNFMGWQVIKLQLSTTVRRRIQPQRQRKIWRQG